MFVSLIARINHNSYLCNNGLQQHSIDIRIGNAVIYTEKDFLEDYIYHWIALKVRLSGLWLGNCRRLRLL